MFSFTIKLLILFNPFGCLEKIRSHLHQLPMSRSKTILIREWGVALAVMLTAGFCGKSLFNHLGIEMPAVQTAGGCALFVSALAMLFPKDMKKGDIGDGILMEREPFIVPLAIPQMAGAGILTNIVIETNTAGCQTVCGAVLVVAFTCLVFWRELMFREKLLSQRVLMILDRFMGFLFITIAVNMVMTGIKSQFSL